MNELLTEIKDICSKYQITSLQGPIDSVDNLAEERLIDIAIFGQFKAGKSSFINSFLQKHILPTGVVPVTSVITRIFYGNKEKAWIKFNDGRALTIRLDEIGDYITEAKNPDNIKRVSIANIEIREMEPFRGLCFVDTPGLGSIYLNNSKTAKEWTDQATIAIVCISAERPLSETDLSLIKELQGYSYRLVCLLTKTDLFTQPQLQEIRLFLRQSLMKEIKTFELYSYSVFNNTDIYRNEIIENICKPFLGQHEKEIEKILRHKTRTIASGCLNYIEIAWNASLKTDDERGELRSRIFTEKTNIRYIRQELRLITESEKAMVREEIYERLQKYNTLEFIKEIKADFKTGYDSWKGNLYVLSRRFEQWLKSELAVKLKAFADNEQPGFNELLSRINDHYNFYTKTFREKLSDNIYDVLGIRLSSNEWVHELKPLIQPDVSIYQAFDSHIDLYWFLFPMILFKKLFRRHFSRQIETEIEKNITRMASDISEIINKEIDNIKAQTLSWIFTELETLEKVLAAGHSISGELSATRSRLEEIIKENLS